LGSLGYYTLYARTQKVRPNKIVIIIIAIVLCK